MSYPPTENAVPSLTRPGLSVVIVSYDSRSDLETCLPSLYAQSRAPDEIIMVDNRPGDGTAEWLHETHPDVRVVTSERNGGYAGGNNLGIANARFERVLLLNPDTVVHEEALERLMQTAETHPDAIVTPKLLNPDGTINACGLDMHITGITTCRAYKQAADSVREVQPVPIASGAAMLARKALFEDVGNFDESYFMYLEDLDLSLRARLQGYRILCDSEAVITHSYALGMSPGKFRRLERNRLVTLLKLLRPRTLLRLLPALLLTECATTTFAVLRGPEYLSARIGAWRDVGTDRGVWQRARTSVQARRVAGDYELFSGAALGLPYDQLVGSPKLAQRLERLTTPLFKVAAVGLRSAA